MRKKIWIVTEDFFPDMDISSAFITTEIAKKLSENYEVNVICGPSYSRKAASDLSNQDIDSIKIHRVKLFKMNKNFILFKLVRVFFLSLAFFIKSLAIKKKDQVLVLSNPAFIIPLFAFLNKIKGIKFTLLIHDLFPENLIPGNLVKSENNLIYYLTHSIFRSSRNQAQKIIVIGRDMKDLVLNISKGKISNQKIHFIPNWADSTTIFPIYQEPKKNNSKIELLFAGNHGILQNTMELIEIIKEVNNPYLKFVFAGGGSKKNEIVQKVKNEKIKNVSFIESFPREELNKILNKSDIGIVTLKDSFLGQGVPSKSYNILSAGKPILFLGNFKTEISQMINENNVGWSFQFSDKETVVNFLNSIDLSWIEKIKELGENARKLAEEEYAKNKILNQIADTLNS